jgi:K+-sensing histidine kinase KdpD
MKQLSIANQTYLSQLKRYVLAFVALGLAVGLRILLDPVLGQGYPFLTIFIAVVFSSWYCGLGPSIAAATAGLLYAWYDFIPPAHSFALTDPMAQIGGMVGFCINAGAVIAYAEVSRRARNAAKASSEGLLLAQQVAHVGSFEWDIPASLIK